MRKLNKCPDCGSPTKHKGDCPRNRKNYKVKTFRHGVKYQFIDDYIDPIPIIGGKIHKGTIVEFDCPNLGYARFLVWPSKVEGFLTGVLSMKPKDAFRFLSPLTNNGDLK